MTGLEASPGPFVGGLFHTDKEQILRHNLKVTREKELEVETRKRITPEEKVGWDLNNAIVCSSIE